VSDYEPDDFTGKGYYLITYGGQPKPAGPYDSPAELAQAHMLADYPDNGYIIHYGDELGMVSSLNPEDLFILRERFTTPFAQHANRNGQPFVVLRVISTPDATHDAEVLPQYRIRFPDNTEIDAWPEEIIE
jgi:hypothetical protein